MANTKCTTVTKLDNVPSKAVDLNLLGARLREQVGLAEVAAAHANGATYIVGRVHSSWRISSIEIFNDAITSGTGFDLGVYDTEANGGAAVDDDLFAATVTMVTARVAPLDVLFEALNIDKIEKRLWELLPGPLTSDPNKFYDLVLTADVVGSGDGTIAVRTRWVEGS